MGAPRRADRGFSLVELMMLIAVFGAVMTIAVPALTDVSEGTRLTTAARELERELQSARLKAVTTNRILRVRLNCPAEGYFRTVEYLSDSRDDASDRCRQSVYAYPADNDLMTRPNYDGPVRVLPPETTVTSAVLQFHPDGTARQVVSNAMQAIATPVTVTVTRRNKTKAITINGAGKIRLE